MTAARTSAWSRRFLVAGVAFLVAWGVAALADAPSRTLVVLALHGFVSHTVFGKAYALVPPYFDREFQHPVAQGVHLPASVGGAALLAGAPLRPSLPLEAVGAAAWAVGVALFVGTLAWTVRDNLTGAETGTGEANAERRPLDRTANAFVPVALAYLLAGSYETLAHATALPPLLGPLPARASHLLAAGFAGVTLFAVGFRLLPRFLVATVPRSLAAVVLAAGAAGPALLAWSLYGDAAFHAAAMLQAVAVVGYAAAVGLLLVRTDRRRVGLYGVGLGAVAGVAAVGLGLTLAMDVAAVGTRAAHRRLNLLGFLGLTIAGVTYQFYPPAVGKHPLAGDRTAVAALGLLAGGLALQVGGLLGGASAVVTAGEAAVGGGAALHAFLVGSVLAARG